MSRSYKATGINLKGMPLGETDRLLTILTIERGLIRVIAPGARKHKSRLAGRSSQFVVNEVLIVQGKRLDKLVQAETVRSFPGLASDLAKLTASQYLAELVLCQALSEQPQQELFTLLVEHLQRLEQATGDGVLACLSQGIFHLLALAGVAPEVQRCSLSQVEIVPDFTQPDWRVGFSPMSGGIVSTTQLNQHQVAANRARMASGRYAVKESRHSLGSYRRSPSQPEITLITALELALLQRLGQPALITGQSTVGLASGSEKTRLLWQRIERLLRQYAQHHFDRPIRSATLMDTCFPITVPAE
ncbi:MAG: DNA repair protein RecO [Leptolyngbya sp. SIO1E4]|nr:DNA repair protein RecO [Leptolyngbya sp. SIO1E4]